MSSIDSKNIFLFDCDGVILDSNRCKTDAYYEILKEYDKKLALKFVDYHLQNGGISRFVKFKMFFKDYLRVENFNVLAKQASDEYMKLTINELKQCKINDGFLDFLAKIKDKKYIVSGGAQTDLIEVFKYRNLYNQFDGIYGSPPTKYEIIESLDIEFKDSVYFGDSRFDYEVSNHFNIDFIFMSKLTEFTNWKEYFSGKDIMIVDDFTSFEGV